ncbi:MAG: T9SS type A sorting domain-containing protein, partial [Flavobacteriales bacterium]|nr:T9SS type A sorting domain-containing protein [Flavobacteriales bacterium]
CATCSGEQDGTGTVVDNDTDSDGVCDSDEIQGCTDATACNYNEDANTNDGSCYNLTVAIDTSSLTSVLTAIVSPADSVVAFSWLYNGAEVGIESSYTALENGVYSVEVSNSTCDASASFEIQYVSLHELNSLEVNLYPNPFKDVINIEFIKATSNIELRILNTLGEEVKHDKIVKNRDGSEIQIQVSDLPKGMYILRVNLDNYLNSFVLIKN